MEHIIKKYETSLFCTNTWVISYEPHSIVIIDPGGPSASLIQLLKDMSIKHIDIMLTHGHFDHTAGIPSLIQEFPDYSLWIHRLDAFYLGEESKEMHRKSFSSFHAEYLIDSLEKDLPEPTGYLDEKDDINGFSILYTPGHTKGSVCLWKKDSNILFSGDTLFFRSYGRTDLLDGNEMLIHQSLHKLFVTLPDSTVVHPGHGPSTTIGAEKKLYQYQM